MSKKRIVFSTEILFIGAYTPDVDDCFEHGLSHTCADDKCQLRITETFWTSECFWFEHAEIALFELAHGTKFRFGFDHIEKFQNRKTIEMMIILFKFTDNLF